MTMNEDQRTEGEPQRQRGASPVVDGRSGKLGKVAGFVAMLVVVGFLFVSGGMNHKPQPAAKTAVLSNAQGQPPAPPDLPPLPADEAQAGFPAPPVPGQRGVRDESGGEAADNARQKEEARLHAPMLIYDVSGGSEPAAPKPEAHGDAMTALLASQFQSQANAAANAGDGKPAATPAEGYAERTQAFAHAAADEKTPEAHARRISLDDRLAQGRMLAATLETAISSDLPGKLRAVVTADVWSEDGSRRLILKGSRLIGEYRSGLVRGQTRVFVIWTRVLQPDGTDVSIGSPGTDDLGRAGLTGTIDRHFAERFGAAFLLSLIGSATTASQGGNTFVINTSQGFGQVAQESLQDSINIPPTIFIDQGAPVQVLVAKDLVFDEPPANEAQ
ncbi:MAG: conjugal transfer protein [Nevskia sp.]|nr:conjugal transfer protein [Nevskia sp.]